MGPFLKSRVHADIGIMQFYIERKYRNINIISIFYYVNIRFFQYRNSLESSIQRLCFLENAPKYKDVSHQRDVWHGAKNIAKKVITVCTGTIRFVSMCTYKMYVSYIAHCFPTINNAVQ